MNQRVSRARVRAVEAEQQDYETKVLKWRRRHDKQSNKPRNITKER